MVENRRFVCSKCGSNNHPCVFCQEVEERKTGKTTIKMGLCKANDRIVNIRTAAAATATAARAAATSTAATLSVVAPRIAWDILLQSHVTNKNQTVSANL